METITLNTIPEEIGVLKPYAPYLMYGPSEEGKEPSYKTIAQWGEIFPTWPLESMVYGLQRVTELASQGPILYDVYSPEEIAEDPTRKDVKVWFMPACEQPSDKPFVLCYAGGAYQFICSDVEAFPTAARLNELGYNVFVPTYRVGIPNLMPKPIEDIAATLQFIYTHKDTFGIRNDHYIVNGYSAGANLTCNWGLSSIGYAKYSMPKPTALLPIYPVTTWEANTPESLQFFLGVMLGQGSTAEDAADYDIVKTMTADYPPCYIVHAKDDHTVPFENSVLLKQKLDALHIPAVLELVESGDHGFGDGRGTPAEGWVDRSIAFVETL